MVQVGEPWMPSLCSMPAQRSALRLPSGSTFGTRNLACMFTMMNSARLNVGLQGVAIADRAYQQALSYARAISQPVAPSYTMVQVGEPWMPSLCSMPAQRSALR
jgi:alkylation response protein AidB-like acyl-CoA dehydrogenase